MWIEPCQGPRPSDFVIERSLDNGTTWKPALYLATDCQKVFPDIATALPIRLEEPHCVTLPPTAENPYQDQNVRFDVFWFVFVCFYKFKGICTPYKHFTMIYGTLSVWGKFKLSICFLHLLLHLNLFIIIWLYYLWSCIKMSNCKLQILLLRWLKEGAC